MPRGEREAEGETGSTGEDSSAADRVDEAFKVIEKPFFVLFAKTKQNTRKITYLTVLVIFDVVMFLSFGYVALRADHAVETAEKARIAAAISQCESGNDFRRLDLQRWLYVLKVAGQLDPSISKEQKARTLAQNEKFRSYIMRADKLRDCSAIVLDQKEPVKPQGE